MDAEQAIEETKQTILNLTRNGLCLTDVQASEELRTGTAYRLQKIEQEEYVHADQHEQLRTERERLDQERMKVRVEQEYWQRKLNESFADLENRDALEQDERPDDELREKVEFYRRRLSQLGMVNELAIEEFEESNCVVIFSRNITTIW